MDVDGTLSPSSSSAQWSVEEDEDEPDDEDEEPDDDHEPEDEEEEPDDEEPDDEEPDDDEEEPDDDGDEDGETHAGFSYHALEVVQPPERLVDEAPNPSRPAPRAWQAR